MNNSVRSRLPELDLRKASVQQKQVLDNILHGPRGNLSGPFLSWIHSPELAQRAQHLGAFCRYDTGISLRLSELAILCTAAQWRSQAEWQIHYPIGLGAGLDRQTLEDIRQGRSPTFPNREEALIWELVKQLYERKRVPAQLYQEAESTFGTTRLVNLVGLLGYYALVAITLNVFEVTQSADTATPFMD